MKKVIITTVGTSLFENYRSTEIQDCFQTDYKGISTLIKNIKDNSETSNDYDKCDIEIEEIERIITPYFFTGIHKNRTDNGRKWKLERGVLNVDASAEITSIIAIAEKEEPDVEIEIHLIATDTVLSVFAAELIEKWFKQNKPAIKVFFQRPNELKTQKDSDYVIHKLRVSSNEDYQEGFMNLIEVVTALIKSNKEAKNETVLNITGGYKAIIPILTLVGQLEEVPLKYIYDENSLNKEIELVEVKNLPISFDWVVVEALKPFLKKEFLKKEEIDVLGKFWFKKQIRFQNNKFLSVSSADEVKLALRSIPNIYHQVFNSLVYYNLIRWNTTIEAVDVNYIGMFLKSLTIGFEKGYIMELLLHKYFLTPTNDNPVTKKYRLLDEENINSINNQLKKTPHFKITDLETKSIQLVKQSKEIGDLDIPLKENTNIVWGESKAFSAATDYLKVIGGKKDYYLQLKARALVSNELGGKMKNLLIIFRFVFKGINDSMAFITTELNSTLEHLEKLNDDNDIENSNFKAIGVDIPLKFKGDKIDFTDFYKGEFKYWKWFEL
jgi:putative CRISPR-associated protein (TIGR02619 family)